MTNLEFIRTADEKELALRLMCPYDLEGFEFDKLPCTIDKALVTPGRCHKCLTKWLHQERKVKE